MSKFEENLREKIAEINAKIMTAGISERRALQRERAQLEAVLRKVDV